MTSIPRNIELFDRIVALTLVRLYESFPNPVDLNATGLGYEIAESIAAEEEEAFRIMTETAENSVRFLVKEGFIRYDERAESLDESIFHGTTLTLRGFTLLGSTPATINESTDRRTFIEQLRGTVYEGAKDSASEIIKSLFTGAISLGAAAIGAG